MSPVGLMLHIILRRWAFSCPFIFKNNPLSVRRAKNLGSCCAIEKNTRSCRNCFNFFGRFYAKPVWKYCVKPISNSMERVLHGQQELHFKLTAFFLMGLHAMKTVYYWGYKKFCAFFVLSEFFSMGIQWFVDP
jgi:hypothetical protein